MSLVRILIPSWRFFDRLGRVPEVLYRVKIGEEWNEWAPCLKKPERKWYHLFINPEGNMYLAYQALIDRLLDDSQKTKNLEAETSFQLIKNLVRETTLKNYNGTHYAFKVKVTYYDTIPQTSTEVFVTHEYEVSE